VIVTEHAVQDLVLQRQRAAVVDFVGTLFVR